MNKNMATEDKVMKAAVSGKKDRDDKQLVSFKFRAETPADVSSIYDKITWTETLGPLMARFVVERAVEVRNYHGQKSRMVPKSGTSPSHIVYT